MTLQNPAQSNDSRKGAKGFPLSSCLMVFTALIILLAILLTGLRIHNDRNRTIKEDLGLRLLGIVQTAALMIDGDKHEEIVASEDVDLPVFLEIRSLLQQVKESNSIESPIYTLRRIDDHTEFVVMTDTVPYIGNRYRLTERMLFVFRDGKSVFTPLYTDQHGEWISAYAPIKDSEGEVVGLLELDYSVTKFRSESREHLKNLIAFSIVSFLVASILGMILSHAITKPIRSQIKAMNHVIETDNLDVNLAPVNNIKELNELSGTFNTLTDSLADSREKVRSTRTIAMHKLAELAEKRDPETGEHLVRMAYYAEVLARELGKSEKYASLITEEWIKELFEAAPLHDIGKVGIEDKILLKPGKLNDEEFKIMKTHAAIGEEILQGPDFFTVSREVAGAHHEKWDGSGYPKGIAGENIPLAARILALGDVYDALTSRRIYKEPFSHEKSKSIIMEGIGAHFDPEVVQAFLDIEEEFKGIRAKYHDA